jgi:hypothetical protein
MPTHRSEPKPSDTEECPPSTLRTGQTPGSHEVDHEGHAGVNPRFHHWFE